MKAKRRMAWCYALGILGYALGMALSLFGELPGALLALCVTAALALLLAPRVSPGVARS